VVAAYGLRIEDEEDNTVVEGQVWAVHMEPGLVDDIVADNIDADSTLVGEIVIVEAEEEDMNESMATDVAFDDDDEISDEDHRDFVPYGLL